MPRARRDASSTSGRGSRQRDLNADEWIPIRPGSEAAVALGMASVIAGDAGAAGPYADVLRAYSPAAAAQAAGVSEDSIRELAERFASQSPTLALGPGVGGHHRNATAANLAVMILNDVAGNVGRTVHYDADVTAAAGAYADMESAVSAMAAGQVGVAMVHGANPAYSMPAASGFVEAFSQAAFKVSFASAMDETAALADLILPDRHFLEAWGDSMPRPRCDGAPAAGHAGGPALRLQVRPGTCCSRRLAHLGNDFGATTFYEFMRNGHMEMHDSSVGDFEESWRQALRDRRRRARHGHDRRPRSQLQAPDVALSFDTAGAGSGWRPDAARPPLAEVRWR